MYETTAVISDTIIEIKAYGATRGSRSGKIKSILRWDHRIAALRHAGRVGARLSVSYDEMHGFMSMTTARYQIVPKSE